MVNSRMIHRGRPVVGNPTSDLSSGGWMWLLGAKVFQSRKIDRAEPQTADFWNLAADSRGSIAQTALLGAWSSSRCNQLPKLPCNSSRCNQLPKPPAGVILSDARVGWKNDLVRANTLYLQTQTVCVSCMGILKAHYSHSTFWVSPRVPRRLLGGKESWNGGEPEAEVNRILTTFLANYMKGARCCI